MGKELSLNDFIKLNNLNIDDLKNNDFWKNNPQYRLLRDAEFNPYAVIVLF